MAPPRSPAACPAPAVRPSESRLPRASLQGVSVQLSRTSGLLWTSPASGYRACLISVLFVEERYIHPTQTKQTPSRGVLGASLPPFNRIRPACVLYELSPRCGNVHTMSPPQRLKRTRAQARC